MQKTWAKTQEQSQRATRISDGVEDVKNSTKGDREKIMAKWKELSKTTRQRQKKCKEEAEKVLYDEETADVGRKHAAKEASSSTKSDRPGLPPPSLGTSSNPKNLETQQTAVVGDDAAFERDLEMAKQLSLAEQRGYERGLASQPG